jgi:hypothetical protein
MPAKDSAQIAVDRLSAKQAKAEHARLEAEIKQHDERYYQKDAPTVSDAAYDALRRRYVALEERFPDLRTFESLSVRWARRQRAASRRCGTLCRCCRRTTRLAKKMSLILLRASAVF